MHLNLAQHLVVLLLFPCSSRSQHEPGTTTATTHTDRRRNDCIWVYACIWCLIKTLGVYCTPFVIHVYKIMHFDSTSPFPLAISIYSSGQDTDLDRIGVCQIGEDIEQLFKYNCHLCPNSPCIALPSYIIEQVWTRLGDISYVRRDRCANTTVIYFCTHIVLPIHHILLYRFESCRWIVSRWI